MKRIAALIAGIVLTAVMLVLMTYRANEETVFPGYMEADLVLVGSEQGGRVLTLSVEEGDRVKQGDPVFTLGLLHQGFNAYADMLSQSAQKEWEKVAGRFEEILFDQPLDRCVVDRHPIGAVGLGGPQNRSGRSVHVGAGEADGGVAEIDLGPAQPEQLAAPRPGRRGQPQVGGEVRIAVLDVPEQSLDLFR